MEITLNDAQVNRLLRALLEQAEHHSDGGQQELGLEVLAIAEGVMEQAGGTVGLIRKAARIRREAESAIAEMPNCSEPESFDAELDG